MYKLVENFRDNAAQRDSFFDLITTVFGRLDFKTWHNWGFWTESYIPHSLINQSGQVIANVSSSLMRILLNGTEIRGVQIGTVATHPAYRGQGLSRRLMERALEYHAPATDLFFLFADEDVLHFYPKFGFMPVCESIYVKKNNLPDGKMKYRKMSIQAEEDREIIRRLIVHRRPLTAVFGALDFGFVTWWHLINRYPDDIFYFDDHDVIIIATLKNKTLQIWDIISTQIDRPEQMIGTLAANKEVTTIDYYFPPDLTSLSFDAIQAFPDMHLFIKGPFLPENTPFKFPLTAQT